MSDLRRSRLLKVQEKKDAGINSGNSGQPEDNKMADCKITIESKNRKEQEMADGGSPHETRVNLNLPEGAFAIMEHERNDPHNPVKESTNTLPILIRRIESREILPAPFRTTTQLLVCTYLTCICCCCCGAFAAKAAFQAKLLRNKGLYVSAEKQARRALYCMLAAVISGLVIFALVAGLTIPYFLEMKKHKN